MPEENLRHYVCRQGHERWGPPGLTICPECEAQRQRVAEQARIAREIAADWCTKPAEAIELVAMEQLDKQMLRHMVAMEGVWDDKQTWALMRVLGKKDLFWFAANVLGMNAKNYGADLQIGLHDEVCNLLEDEGNGNSMVLLPRYCLKTMLVTVAGRIWATVRYPDKRLAIGSGTRFHAVKRLDLIKQQLMTNKVLQGMYPDRLPLKNAIWNEDRIMLPRSASHSEATMEIIAPDVQLTGAHYDEIALDDIVNDQTVVTPEQRLKTVEFMSKVRPILSPGGRIILVGTRWHDQDYYGMVQEAEDQRKARGEKPKVCCYIRKAIEQGKSVFPAVLSMEFLEEQRQDPPDGMGAYLFSCNYMQDPIAEGGEFKPEWLKYYEHGELDLLDANGKPRFEFVSYYTTVDLASSKAAYADFTVVMTCGVTADNHLYVVYYDRGKVDSPTTVEWIIKHWNEYGPRKVGVESVGYQQTLIHWLEKASNQRRLAMNIHPIKRTKSTGTKADRISRLTPFLKAGQIHIGRHQVELIDEILRWSPNNAKHDDLLDCLADQVELFRPVRRARWENYTDTYQPLSMVTGR